MVQSILKWLWEKADGWKAVIGYVLASLPDGIDHAPLSRALSEAIATPNISSISTALGHILLVFALVHRAAKNTGLVSVRNDSAVQRLTQPPPYL